MAGRGLGSLTLDLILKTGGFEQGWDRAARITNKRANDIEKRAYAMGKAMGGALRSAATGLLAFTGVTVGVAAGINAIKSAIDRADNIRDLSIRLGISTERLSGFSYAAKQTGTDIEDLNKGLLRLSKNAAAALDPKSRQANLFEALGVSKDSLTDLEKLVPQVADAFKQIDDGATKAALAQELFGRSGANLIEFLNQGSDGLANMADRAEELGIIIDGQTAQAADEFNDTLGDLKAVSEGYAQQVAVGLLPAIKELTQSFLAIVKDGDSAVEVGRQLGNAFEFVGALASAAATRIDGVGKIIEGLTAGFVEATAAAKAFLSLDFKRAADIARGSDSDALIMQGLRQGVTGVRAGSTPGPFDDVRSRTSSLQGRDFALAQARAKRQKDAEERLLGFFKDPTPSGGKSRTKTGKSDAEKEAEKIARAIEQMTKAQQEWQNELAKTGNPIADEYASRLREITEQAKGFAEDGVSAEKVKAFTDEMQRLATSLRDSDIAELQKEFNEATDQMTANMQGPMKQALLDYEIEVKKIDELLKLGIITIEEYNARMGVLTQQRDEPATGLLDALNEEIMLLGMSSEQQEIYNNLKRAGVEANSKFGPSIIATTELLQQAREEAEFLDELKDGLSNLFVDFVSGAKSAKDAFGDFADAIFARALQFVADQAVQALFEAFSGPKTGGQSSSGGGGWAGFFSSILGAFGGGRAEGGSLSPGMFYRVNERGPELATINGNDYLMMGSNSGRVTPNRALKAGSTSNQVNNFNFLGRVDRRSQDQVEAALAQRSRRAVSRNA